MSGNKNDVQGKVAGDMAAAKQEQPVSAAEKHAVLINGNIAQLAANLNHLCVELNTMQQDRDACRGEIVRLMQVNQAQQGRIKKLEDQTVSEDNSDVTVKPEYCGDSPA